MDLKQLQYFVVSVDSGSLKKAAKVLYTSQPHISKTIKSLEAELQVELLTRKYRGVEVTEEGRKVYEYACRILVEAGRIQNVRGSQAPKALSVAAVSDSRLEELFQRFYAKELPCPVRAQYIQCSMEEIFQHIHRHTAEMGFVHVDARQMTAFKQTLEYRHLEFVPLAEMEPLLFVGPKNPLFGAELATGKDLRGLQYVQLRDEQEALSIQLIQGAEDYRYYRNRGQVLVTDSRQMVVQMLLSSPLASISCGLSGREAGSEKIRGIPIRGMKEKVTFGYIKRKRDGISEEAEAFVSYIKMHWKR